MGNPVVPIPQIIQGPAVIQFGNDTFYSKGGVKLKTTRASFNVDDDFHGQTDVRAKGQAVTEISFNPVGSSAQLTERFRVSFAVVVAGGTSGHVVGDTLTAVGGTAGTTATFKVAAVTAGGVVTSVTVLEPGDYTIKPSNPVATTGGDNGVTLTVSWANFSPIYRHSIDSVGKSIFGIVATPLIIWTVDGRKITYHRAGLQTTPNLVLRPSATLIGGDMTFRAIGIAATEQTDPAFLLTRSTLGFTDQTFDESKLVTDIYSAAFGTTPYDAIGAMDGFEIDIKTETTDIETDDFGLVDTVIKSLVATAKFKPSNLTEAQVDTLLNYQDAAAILPGKSFSTAGTDLIISGVSGTLVATLYKAGPHQNAQEYKTAAHVHDTIEFVSKRTWTTGVANKLWSFVVS